MIYDTLIIGGGASGLYAASQIRSGRIALLESNSQIGAKLAVSGGGRCNVTNAELAPHHYDGDAAFIQSVLRQYDNRALLADLQKGGVETTLRESVVPGQYFCRSSSEILHYLERSIRHVDLFLKSKVVDLERPLTSADRTAHFQITTQERQFFARRLLLATGGPSYPQLGASSFGQELLQKWGHSVSRLHPALVGFTLMPPERWMCELSGLSTPVEIGVDGQKIGGGLLFSHRGITGPAVMNSSLRWRKGKISIDWLPNFSLKQLFSQKENRLLSTALPLPKRLARALLEAHQIGDRPLSSYSKSEEQQLQILKNDLFAPAGTFGLSRAEVTRGGVSTSEVDPQTMESRLVSNLFIAGELLDVTGELGGYNLQWAFSTAQVAARAIEERNRTHLP